MSRTAASTQAVPDERELVDFVLQLGRALTEAGSAVSGIEDRRNAIGTIISIALGVLCGVTLYRNAIDAPRRLRRLAGRSGDDV